MQSASQSWFCSSSKRSLPEPWSALAPVILPVMECVCKVYLTQRSFSKGCTGVELESRSQINQHCQQLLRPLWLNLCRNVFSVPLVSY